MYELACKKTYSEVYDKMRWLLPNEIEEATGTRKLLLDDIESHPGSNWAYAQTKLYTHALSPGCILCGQGEWSCLFINGICNARCFYCPTAQNDPGQPMANTIVFENPETYANFVSRFQIKGVGFSGGEPLLTFDRLLAYLEALKTRVDQPVYTWMYTNGILANRENLAILRSCGLDEIRFDLSANQYNLNAVEFALHTIPRVTVEIPAIPEDISTLKQLIIRLHQMGVDHLNLHQMRCTPFNVKHLIDRRYTFLHGPQITVWESELTALSLIKYALERSIELPINYCAFTFRHQFQGMGARRRSAWEIKASYEDITPTGHIRHMQIVGPETVIAKICQTFVSNGVDASLYLTADKGGSLSFAAELWPFIDFAHVRLKVRYRLAVLTPTLSYHHVFKEIILPGNKKLFVEKQTIQDAIFLEGEQIKLFGQMISKPEGTMPEKMKDDLSFEQRAQIVQLEIVSSGLARYY